MNEICPICNGLYDAKRYCSMCNIPLEQMGRVEDYKGSYSPYMDEDTFLKNNVIDITGDNCCIHLYICSSCGTIYHGSTELISV